MRVLLPPVEPFAVRLFVCLNAAHCALLRLHSWFFPSAVRPTTGFACSFSLAGKPYGMSAMPLDCEAVVTKSCEHLLHEHRSVCSHCFCRSSNQGSNSLWSFTLSCLLTLLSTGKKLLRCSIHFSLAVFYSAFIFINTFFGTALILVIESQHGMPTDNAGAFSFTCFYPFC